MECYKTRIEDNKVEMFNANAGCLISLKFEFCHLTLKLPVREPMQMRMQNKYGDL
jgi:hypothetical protein